MKIKIRKVRICDAPNLLPIIKQLGYPINEEDLIARIALYENSHYDSAWVALEDEVIIGCLALHIYDLFHSVERYARIVSLIVDQNHRRKGVGSLLIARAERYAASKNCNTLELSSSLKRVKLGSHDFYDAVGYKNEGEFESRYLRKFITPKTGPYI